LSSLTKTADLKTAWKNLDKAQLLKWTVYLLLLINWGYYFLEEIYISSHTLRQGGSFLDWTREFATTIDEFAWFGLLFMFELETYQLDDETYKKKGVRWGIHGLRLLCYVFLTHTIFARVTDVNNFNEVVLAPEISSICQLADKEISFGANYFYTEIDQKNCLELSKSEQFYYLEPSVITDQDGYELERRLLWVDMIEACTWLLIMFALELGVWLQNRNITGGRLMLVSHGGKLLYGVLWTAAAYWLYKGHWVYAWDESLWILGFWAIESNMSEWRDEIREEEGQTNEC
jgi:hypothetical protein